MLHFLPKLRTLNNCTKNIKSSVQNSYQLISKNYAHNGNFNQSYQFNTPNGIFLNDLKYRIVCLQLFLSRWGMEAGIKRGIPENRVALAVRGIENAIDEVELKDKMSNKEKQFLTKPLGSWTEAEIFETSWQWEDFGLLQWTLGLVDKVPSIHDQFNQALLFKNTSIQPNNVDTIFEFINQTYQPPSNDTISDLQAKLEIWNWRCQAQELLNLKSLNQNVFKHEIQHGTDIVNFSQLPVGFQKMINELPKAIENTAELSYAKGLLEHVKSKDFATVIEDKLLTFGELKEGTIGSISNITNNRLHALAYVMGALEWDDHISILNDKTLGAMPSIWQPEE